MMRRSHRFKISAACPLRSPDQLIKISKALLPIDRHWSLDKAFTVTGEGSIGATSRVHDAGKAPCCVTHVSRFSELALDVLPILVGHVAAVWPSFIQALRQCRAGNATCPAPFLRLPHSGGETFEGGSDRQRGLSCGVERNHRAATLRVALNPSLKLLDAIAQFAGRAFQRKYNVCVATTCSLDCIATLKPAK